MVSPHHHSAKRADFMLKNFAQEHTENTEGALALSSARSVSSCSNLSIILLNSPSHSRRHAKNVAASSKHPYEPQKS